MGFLSTSIITLSSSSLLPLFAGRFHVKHHGRKGNAQLDGRLLAIQNTGIAVPAFLGIPDKGCFLFLFLAEHVSGANVYANSAGDAFVLVDDRWHMILPKNR
jgi:hypothetical protein